MKKNNSAILDCPINLTVDSQYNDMFQNSRSVTDISVRDKEWFKRIFLNGENRALEYIAEMSGRELKTEM